MRDPKMVMADVKVPSVTYERACCCFRSRGDDSAARPLLGDQEESAPEKVKRCELVGYDSLPKFLKHNEFVLGYYRSEWPLKETVLSIFSIHNETLNVWTHLVGFFIFLALTVLAAVMLPAGEAGVLSLQHLRADAVGGTAPLSPLSNATQLGRVPYAAVNTSPSGNYTIATSSSLYFRLPADAVSMAAQRFSRAHTTADSSISKAANVSDAAYREAAAPSTPLQPITRWPFFVFLCGAMLCLLASSSCHLLSCHSEHTSYLMLRLDYAGISALIVTSILPGIYYIFACDPFMQNLYASAITICGIATVVVSLFPVFETPEFRFMRSLLFVCMALLGWVPIAHKHILFGDRPEAMLTTLYEFLMNCCYGVGVVIYATRVPERWMPGKFDLVGHSHQLFHVLVIAGAYLEYLAVLVYLQWRDTESC